MILEIVKYSVSKKIWYRSRDRTFKDVLKSNKIIVIRAIEPLFYYAYKGSFLNALMITLENGIYQFKNFKNTNRKIFISIK